MNLFFYSLPFWGGQAFWRGTHIFWSAPLHLSARYSPVTFIICGVALGLSNGTPISLTFLRCPVKELRFFKMAPLLNNFCVPVLISRNFFPYSCHFVMLHWACALSHIPYVTSPRFHRLCNATKSLHGTAVPRATTVWAIIWNASWAVCGESTAVRLAWQRACSICL